MSKKITIQVPLTGTIFGGLAMDDFFTVAPPCFYCGQPVDNAAEHYYKEQGTYQIKYWGRGQKFGSPMLGDVVDSNGSKLMGKYTVQLPYCPEHVAPFRPFQVIDSLAVILGGISALGLLALMYFTKWAEGGELLIFLFALPIFCVGVLYVLGLIIKSIIAKINPKLKDYSKRNGHYGVTLSGVATSGGAPMVGPITYTLTMEVTNPHSAQRFLQANPRAKVIKGEELLKAAE